MIGKANPNAPMSNDHAIMGSLCNNVTRTLMLCSEKESSVSKQRRGLERQLSRRRRDAPSLGKDLTPLALGLRLRRSKYADAYYTWYTWYPMVPGCLATRTKQRDGNGSVKLKRTRTAGEGVEKGGREEDDERKEEVWEWGRDRACGQYKGGGIEA